MVTADALPYNSSSVGDIDLETILFPSLKVPAVKNGDISCIDAENCPNVPIGKNVIGSNAFSLYSSTYCNSVPPLYALIKVPPLSK